LNSKGGESLLERLQNSASDFVVVAVPVTDETSKLIVERKLRLLKPTAYLINVARRQIVDQSALIKSSSEDWIAGEELYVFETEPLPADSELWYLRIQF
jgi:glyoxylate reductase